MAAGNNFHQLIAENKRNSVLLILVVFGILFLLGAALGRLYGDLSLGLVIGVVTAGLCVLFAWSFGDSMVLSACGGVEIQKSDAPQLFNVVEEMSIAAGIPMPKVYIIPTDAPNAFATGISPESSSVAVTSGLLQKLNREQLQGVIAHEIGHIRNFDIRVSLLMATLVGGIALLSDIFLRSFLLTGGGSRRRDNNNNGNAQILLIVAGIVLAIIGTVLAQIVQMAVSRQREYLADASAVEFTRNPTGLMEALQILGGDKTPMKSSGAATDNMYIVSPALKLRGGADSLFSTHPPIPERVARLQKLM